MEEMNFPFGVEAQRSRESLDLSRDDQGKCLGEQEKVLARTLIGCRSFLQSAHGSFENSACGLIICATHHLIHFHFLTHLDDGVMMYGEDENHNLMKSRKFQEVL